MKLLGGFAWRWIYFTIVVKTEGGGRLDYLSQFFISSLMWLRSTVEQTECISCPADFGFSCATRVSHQSEVRGDSGLNKLYACSSCTPLICHELLLVPGKWQILLIRPELKTQPVLSTMSTQSQPAHRPMSETRNPILSLEIIDIACYKEKAD